jgi:hypothetical protein
VRAMKMIAAMQARSDTVRGAPPRAWEGGGGSSGWMRCHNESGSRRSASVVMGGEHPTTSHPVPSGRPRPHNVVVHAHHQPRHLRAVRTAGADESEQVEPVLRCSRPPRGRQRLGRAARLGCCLAIALTVLLAGCVRSTSSVEDFKLGPVFELQVIDSRPCPTAADPQLACFAVELRNVGEKAGGGRCVVHHYLRSSGDALVGEGPSFEARLRPGEVLRAQGQAHLTAPFASLRFNSSYCNPGPRL